MISYAQNFEDVILERAFKDKKEGFYVDVGAMDPVEGSVTKHFYDRGWRGVNVEPVSRFHAALVKDRPRDVNLCVALGKSSDKLTFYEFETQGVSTFNVEFADYFIQRNHRHTTRLVDVVRLREICATSCPAEIDFMKIDVEGWEKDILEGGDWTRYRPRVVVIEATRPFSHDPHWEGWEPFLSRANFMKAAPKKAKVVTSIAMFYDLEDPVEFARQVEEVLEDGGVWHLEQSYMPSMLRMNSYDTICHEHLEYYSLAVIRTILDKVGLRVIDVQMNAVNGGSFAVTAAKTGSPYRANRAMIEWLLEQEKGMGLDTPRPFRDFEERVFRHRDDLRRLVRSLVKDGKRIVGYGASTKGNVMLQFCGFTAEDIPAIAEVNADKFGCFTPGTRIPIVSEAEARDMSPDFFLVLPWHFKNGILEREKDFLLNGGKMIFPFPEIEIV